MLLAALCEITTGWVLGKAMARFLMSERFNNLCDRITNIKMTRVLEDIELKEINRVRDILIQYGMNEEVNRIDAILA